MPGPINLDADTIRPPTDIAYKDDAGNWRAGPDAKGYDKGQFVSGDYAQRARAVRRNANMVKNIMREANEGEGVSETEAREISTEIRERLDDAESEEERRGIWRQYVNS